MKRSKNSGILYGSNGKLTVTVPGKPPVEFEFSDLDVDDDTCPDCLGSGVDTEGGEAIEFKWCKRCDGTGKVQPNATD